MKILRHLSFSKIISVSKLRSKVNDIPKEGGVYKHFIDKKGLESLEGVYPTTKEIAADGTEVYLLYIGLSKDLYKRIKWHLGMSCVSPYAIFHGFVSTLRVSYMANHKDIVCLSEQDKLNDFMNQHTYIQYMVTNDYEVLEKQLIEENDLPLNIKGNTHPFVEINKRRRKEIKNNFSINSKDIPTKNNLLYDKSKPKYNNSMINSASLVKYARKAEQEGIKNKSRFVKWSRSSEQKSASQERLYEAWNNRND